MCYSDPYNESVICRSLNYKSVVYWLTYLLVSVLFIILFGQYINCSFNDVTIPNLTLLSNIIILKRGTYGDE